MGSPIVPSDSGSPVAFTPVLNNVVMLVAWACCAGTSSRKVSAATTARPLLVTLNLKILNEELVFIGIAVVRGGYRKLATLSPPPFGVQFNPRHEPTIPDVHNVIRRFNVSWARTKKLMGLYPPPLEHTIYGSRRNQ